MEKDILIEIITGEKKPRFVNERENCIIDKCLEIINNPEIKPIYILTSDGHRDSANLQKYARDEEGLKYLLTQEVLEIGMEVIPESIVIDYQKGLITFKYTDIDDDSDIDDYRYHFLTLQGC